MCKSGQSKRGMQTYAEQTWQESCQLRLQGLAILEHNPMCKSGQSKRGMQKWAEQTRHVDVCRAKVAGYIYIYIWTAGTPGPGHAWTRPDVQKWHAKVGRANVARKVGKADVACKVGKADVACKVGRANVARTYGQSKCGMQNWAVC
eukprot:1156723-Pelagomonas_calceolata.AAC.13